MKFEERHTFEQPAETVMRMYTDRAFFDRKYEAVGALECELLEHSSTAECFVVEYRLVMNSDAPIPEVARKILGSTVKLTQRDTWDPATRTGRLDIVIGGAPVKVGADMKVVDEQGRGVNIQSWSVDCRIPLVGGRIAAALAEDIKLKSRRDMEVSRRIILDY